ncbi:hypothetical protein [Hyalangium rubrum]|uniref:Lipoprotein n=1 Tax=Hyalangium rubrum TaxID=3103134 RepID=A0ABU5H8E0_9BACT|nr:hypothetical protein [Hyalangium sp. s54d21]MDY7229743.1 hypothetical protein [Hyalangium sp. s54d21]
MNVKALAAIVGTLSLGALATGCASNKAATTDAEKGAQASCGAKEGAATDAKGAEGSCGAKPAATPEKGEQGSCGEGSCGGKK